MKSFYKSHIFLAIIIFTGCTQIKDQSPNIILILADDLGYGDVGAYRDLYESYDDGKPEAYLYTPNINHIAKKGVVFSRAYATAWCAPSRQALLSGRFVNRSDAYTFPWLGNRMRNEGYVTGLFGKSHGAKPIARTLENDPILADFDEGLFFNDGMRSYYLQNNEEFPGRVNLSDTTFILDESDYLTDVFTDHAIHFIEKHAEKSKPFFLYLPYTAPHTPLEAKPADLRLLFPDVFGNMSDEEIKATANPGPGKEEMVNYHYIAMVYSMDRGIGAIKKKLEEKGIEDNTVIIFTSDNGAIRGSNYPFDGHKWDGLEGGLRVPFIIWSKDIEKSDVSGTVYDGLVSIVDIAPTILSMANEDLVSEFSDGTNILPFASGEEVPTEDRIYFWANNSSYNHLTGNSGFEVSSHPVRLPQTVYIKGDQKIIHWNTPDAKYVGAVFNELPDAMGKDNPRELVNEKTPRVNEFPTSPDGKELYLELINFLQEQDSSLVPYWSGSPNKIDTDLEWWYDDY